MAKLNTLNHLNNLFGSIDLNMLKSSADESINFLCVCVSGDVCLRYMVMLNMLKLSEQSVGRQCSNRY